MKLIPAIDIMEGKCVRLHKGAFETVKVYATDPVDLVKKYQDMGFKYLHVVDLDGARSKRIVHYKLLEKMAAVSEMIIDFGGGVQSDEQVKIAFESGAAKVTGGSIAVYDKPLFEKWIKLYGNGRIILGADVKNNKIATSGWTKESAETWQEFILYYVQKGLNQVISTDVAQDGTLLGPSLPLYQEMQERFPDVQLIASGGIGKTQDLYDLAALGCYGAILGKALYEERISVGEIKKFIDLNPQ